MSTSSERSSPRARIGARAWLFAGPLVALLVAASAALGYRGGNAGRPPTAPPARAEGDQSADLEARLIMMQARLRSLERAAARATEPGQGTAPGGSTAATGTALADGRAPRPAPPLPASEQDQRQYFADLDTRVQAEPRDLAWASATEEKLRLHAQVPPPGLRIQSARCGQSSCRVELGRDPAQAGPTTVTSFVQSVAAVLPEIVVHHPDDPTRVVLYLQREGAGGFPPLVGSTEAAP